MFCTRPKFPNNVSFGVNTSFSIQRRGLSGQNFNEITSNRKPLVIFAGNDNDLKLQVRRAVNQTYGKVDFKTVNVEDSALLQRLGISKTPEIQIWQRGVNILKASKLNDQFTDALTKVAWSQNI